MAKNKAKTMIEKIREDGLGHREGQTVTVVENAIGTLKLERVAVAALTPHPENPRAVNTKSPKFLDLVESIRANGIIEPLTVRVIVDRERGKAEYMWEILQILSGHRRWEAAKVAGLDRVPVHSLGCIDDALAFDIVAMGNLHEELTPLEEGKRVATWLDKYTQDAKAVASKLGKTEHWVLTHAMIERNLIEAWKSEAIRTPKDEYDRRNYSHWTAEHWTHIARLPAAIQEHWLGKVRKDYRFDPHNATADVVAGWVKTDKLLLKDAPFDTKGCSDCDKRTDAIAQLLWQDPDVTPEESALARCLDPKCWQRKIEKKARDDFKVTAAAAIEKHGITGDKNRAAIVPISMIQPPADAYDWNGRHRYEESLKPAKKAFGGQLVTADRVTVVEKDTKGAVPGIVVAGKGKGTLKWVKVEAKETSGARGTSEPHVRTAKEIEAEKDSERWVVVQDRFWEAFVAAPVPAADRIVVALCFLQAAGPQGSEASKLVKSILAAMKKYPDQPVKAGCEYAWRRMGQDKEFMSWDEEETREAMAVVGMIIGFDPVAEYKRIKAAEAPATPPSGGAACDGDPATCEVGCKPCRGDGSAGKAKGRGRKKAQIDSPGTREDLTVEDDVADDKEGEDDA